MKPMFDIFVNLAESALILFFLWKITDSPADRRTVTVSFVFCLLSSLFITWVNRTAVFEGCLYTLFDILLHYIYLSCITSLPRPLRLFFACFPLVTIAFINTLSAVIVSLILYRTISYSLLAEEHYVFMILLTKTLFILSARLFTAFFRRNLFRLSGKDSVPLAILTFLTFCHLQFYEYIIFGETAMSAGILSSLLCLSLCFILILYFHQIGNTHYLLQQYEKELLQAQLDGIKAQAQQQGDLCRLSHDLKHYINCIPPDDHSREAEDLRRRFDLTYLCEMPYHSGLHTVLNIKKEEARRRDIDMSCRINLPEPAGMENAELCLLVSNLLDNAIRHIGPKKILRVQLDQVSSYSRIRVINSGGEEDVPVHPAEQRNDGHGYGLRTVKAIAEKYHAAYSAMEQDGEYISSVLIPLKKE